MSVNGKVIAVLVGKFDMQTSTQQDKISVLPEGVKGDRHWGLLTDSSVQEKHVVGKGSLVLNRRQLTVVSSEEILEISKHIGINIDSNPDDQILQIAKCLSANIVVAGIPDFTKVASGFLRFSRSSDRSQEACATIMLTGENRPCIVAGVNLVKAYPDIAKISPKFIDAAYEYKLRGQTAMCFSPGLIRTNDKVELLPVQP